MKQIDEFITSNKKIMEKYIDEFEKTDPENINELNRLKDNINKFEYYIKGLEDAKKYIKEEIKEW